MREPVFPWPGIEPICTHARDANQLCPQRPRAPMPHVCLERHGTAIASPQNWMSLVTLTSKWIPQRARFLVFISTPKFHTSMLDCWNLDHLPIPELQGSLGNSVSWLPCRMGVGRIHKAENAPKRQLQSMTSVQYTVI